MFTLDGYKILTKIYESANSLVYRGQLEHNRQPVILKVLKENYPIPGEITRYRKEYEITYNLNLDGAIRAYSLEKYGNTLVIVFEDFGGEALNLWMHERQLSVAEFLELAIKITHCLATVHDAKVIHKDINPSNIVLNQESGELKIIDFGIATILPRENPTLKSPHLLEGTLAYMSPEQTGRMNRLLDYRTDFYSLGAIFYELLTQQLPFPNNGAMELVHSQIAKQPIPLDELNGEIPQVVADIVMKLLSKTAEERYQSAWGIKADLEKCLTQWQTTGNISPFLLGNQDFIDKFQIPQKLYGRESEIATLLNIFEEVASVANKEENTLVHKNEMVLVSGYSGIGKSVLVQELYKPITQCKGYFITGKFDQYQRNIPYSAFIDAFGSLIKQLLSENQASLHQWREKLLAALGANSQVIIEVIPELEMIVGKQPALPVLPPLKAQNRFNLVFQNFLKVFTTSEHPLVIFLDDLQWADLASLKLMELLMSASHRQYFLLIGAYRDHEVNAAHPLMLSLQKIEKAGVVVNHIHLTPLRLFDIKYLVADTLNSTPAQVTPLAELVLAKTGGNPFFVNQFLESLYTEKLLRFDLYRKKLCWDIEQIKARGITDNVVALMAAKIQKLSPQAQELLKLAACIGNQFELEVLALVWEKSVKKTITLLQALMVQGLILFLSDTYNVVEKIQTENLTRKYKFVHDRIQQAAYSLLPNEEKQAIHWQIGQLLLQNTAPEQQEKKIFEIANQLNLGIALITLQEKRDELAQLNLLAGKKAKLSAAYEPAYKYLQTGIELLGKESWQRQHDLTLDLYVEASETAYLSGDFETMESLAEVALQEAKLLLERVKVYEIKIQAYITQNKLLLGVNTGLEVLKLLGIRFPHQPNKLQVLLALVQTKIALRGKKVADLANLPVMSDSHKLATMRILATIFSAAYFAVPELMPLLAFKKVILSIKYGNTSVSAFGYANYGLILCGVVGDIEQGYQFGQLALSLLGQFESTEIKAKIFFIFNCLIRSWREHLRETAQPLVEAYQSGLETGDLEFAALAAHIGSYYSYWSGKELHELEPQVAVYSSAIAQLNQETTLHFLQIWHQLVLNLLGKGEHQWMLIGEAYDEREMLPIHLQANNRTALYVLYCSKMVLCYQFAEYEKAGENSILAKQYLDGVFSTFVFAMFYFYDSLMRLAVFPEDKLSQWQCLFQVAVNQSKLKKWANSAPMNYLHKFYLVEAERYRVLGKNLQASNYYEMAIKGAKNNQFLQEEALAYELAAKFHLDNHRDKIAKFYMTEAHYAYTKWGATAKVKQLEANYPQLLTIFADSVTPTASNLTTQTSLRNSGEVLDLETVIKASQAISEEIILDKLLHKLMKTVIENAGAQKGFLILEQDGEWLIQAEATVDHQVKVLQSVPINFEQKNQQPILATGIINYVTRTQETVVLENATHDEIFNQDPYITKTQAKSILCTPLNNPGQLKGIIYLENNLVTGAFPPERLEVLNILSAQIAISVEKSLLYQQLEEYSQNLELEVAARTQELQEKNEQLQDTLVQLKITQAQVLAQQKQQALRESERKLAQFLEAVPVGIGVLDAQGKTNYLNQKAKELLRKNSLPEAPIEDLSAVYQLYQAGTEKLYPTQKLPAVQALQGEHTTVDDLEIRHPDKAIPIEVWGTPIFDPQGKIAYAIVAFQDITERKYAQRIRIELIRELADKNKALQKAKLENELLRGNKIEYQVGGCLDIETGTYVIREADQQLYDALKANQFCYVLNARQMGKSSLRVRIMNKLQAEKIVCCAIDLTTFSSKNLTEEKWYASLCYQLVDGFNLLEKFDFRKWWHNLDFLPPVQRLRELITKVLLTEFSAPIVIFIDEIDSVLRLQFNTDNFFALIRSFYNERAVHSQYRNLSFVLLGVASPANLIKDPNCTPFNIGTAIPLKPFQLQDVVKTLAKGLASKCSNPQAMLKEVLAWTEGQPFLTQKICYLIFNSQVNISEGEETEWVAKLVQNQIIDNWEFQDNPEHLKTIYKRLTTQQLASYSLLELYQQVLQQVEMTVDNSPETMELLLSGAVRLNRGKLKVYNPIYETVFNHNWVEKNLAIK